MGDAWQVTCGGCTLRWLTVVILDSFEGDAEITTNLASNSMHPNDQM